MSTLFCDTAYFLGLLNPSDVLHSRAIEFSRGADAGLLTTEWVLLEVGDALSRGVNRERFGRLLEILSVSPHTEVVPAESSRFKRGCELFLSRRDKEWSLRDCISFDVMKERSLKEALTSDHHFEQAGFQALLRG